MSLPRILILFFSASFFATAPCWPAADLNTTPATFSVVTGNVTLQAPNSKKKKPVWAGLTAPEGSRVTTGKNSTATLVLFDGSQLEIGPESSLILTTLQKPSVFDKIFNFKLIVGELMATVKKLASSHSSFEISSGGVVCGVRGTKYKMVYDPDARTLDLSVLEGTVYTQVNGGAITNVYAGHRFHFENLMGANDNEGGNSNGSKKSVKISESYLGNGDSSGNNGGTGKDIAVTGFNSGANAATIGTGKDIAVTGFNFNTGDTTGSGVTTSAGANTAQHPSAAANDQPPSSTVNNGIGAPPAPATPSLDNPALVGLNDTFLRGILVNGNNNLTMADQRQNILLVVP